MKKIIIDNIQTIIISVVTTVITTIATIFISYWTYNLQEKSKIREKQEQVCIEFFNAKDEILKTKLELQSVCQKQSKKCDETKEKYMIKIGLLDNITNKTLMFFNVEAYSSFAILKTDAVISYLDPFDIRIEESIDKITKMCISNVRQTSKLMN